VDFNRLFNTLNGEGLKVLQHEPMSRHTSFQIGGPARLLARPTSIKQLAAAIEACRQTDCPYRVVGRGTNLLVDDAGIEALVLLTSDLVWEDYPHHEELWASAGESLSSLCNRAKAAGLSGLEFAYGIPGSVGGGVYMNAGAYGGELKDVLTAVYTLDPHTGGTGVMSVTAADFGYRRSLFMENEQIILGVRFTLMSGDPAEIGARMEDYMARRRNKQPLDLPSAGSIFKRPKGAYAAALIDGCGLKGLRIGGAAVSEKHAGFIVNVGGATCADVLALMEAVRRTVREQTGYELEPEVRVFR
jgi:UDP-N-acetylmuramate dehydrogenase